MIPVAGQTCKPQRDGRARGSATQTKSHGDSCSKTVRYNKGTKIDLATFMPESGKADSIEADLDGDSACDDIDMKTAPGRYVMVGGCRLHSHSKTTGHYALSSGEREITSMSELLKEAKLTQYNLGFFGMGLLPNRLVHRCVRRNSILPQEKVWEWSIWTSGTVGCKRN